MEQKINCVPPGKFERNEYGLLTHVNYSFKEDRYIDWRKMVKPEFLSPKKGVTETDVSKLEDKDLLILLGGLRELAQLRGYHYAKTRVDDAVGGMNAYCEIKWIGNYETEGREIISSGSAKATLDNTDSFTQSYLTEMAENRAFCRAVRQFLKINIVSKEEINSKIKQDSQEEFSPSDPKTTLQKLLNEKKISFDKLKTKLISEGKSEAANYSSISDIPKIDVFEIIEKINAAKK
jgi:hypothetical protein